MTTFSPGATSPSWCERRPCRGEDETWMLAFLEGHPADKIVEIGPGDGTRAAWLLRRFRSADFLAFEPSPACVSRSSAAIATFAERASVERRNLALQLPLGNSTQDVVLCLDILEYLRMDELYMTLAEARRVLRKGGLCFLRTRSFAPGRRGSFAAFLRRLAHRWAPRLVSGSRLLELNHYISPEDWRVVRDTREPVGWVTRQAVVLERL